jgi:S-adenosylmethionine-diacylglycerol 3-amino-3-carboxypropyl transferase
MALYERCRRHLSKGAREYWDQCPRLIEAGIGSGGKLERYLRVFRTRVLPLIHRRQTVERLFAPKACPECRRFYELHWNNLRWQLLFRAFFSRLVMGKLGRDRELFRHAEGGVAGPLLLRMRYALTELDPATNPYLHWIFKGEHADRALPFALRPENFDAIRSNLDRLESRCCSLQDFVTKSPVKFDAFNLSDIFEYLSIESYERLLRLLIRSANPNARLAYWNLLVPRSRPESLVALLQPLKELSEALSRRDKAFIYKTIVVEEVLGTFSRALEVNQREVGTFPSLQALASGR